MNPDTWYHLGLRFQCTGCGDCCTGAPGYVWINNASQHFMGAPFGGVKQSGIGREECFAELLEFTYTKNVNLKLG